MILSFNPTVFQSKDPELESFLAEILIELSKAEIHFLDLRGLGDVFFDQDYSYIFGNHHINAHLSPIQTKSLEDFIKKKTLQNITVLYRKHLTHIVVGLDESNKEIHPSNAINIIKERSKIIIENGINDWKFIQGISQKYSGSKMSRKSIYALVDKAIKFERIEAENAGGVGEIKKVIERWMGNIRYVNIFRYKLMVMFDSDRKQSDEMTPHKDKIMYIKGKAIDDFSNCFYEDTDLLVWHILYKKKIENYVPLKVLLVSLSSISPELKASLESQTPNDLDFIEYNSSIIGLSEKQIKSKFPDMFLTDFAYRDFEDRCSHHKTYSEEAGELISEMEQILLKVAKVL